MPSCDAVLSACDSALRKEIRLTQAQAQQIKNYTELSGLQKKIIVDQETSLKSPLRDPVKVALGTAVLVVAAEIFLGVFKK